MYKLNQKTAIASDSGEAISRIRGIAEGKYLLLDLGPVNFKTYPGQQVFGRVVMNGVRRNFTTSVKGSIPDLGLLMVSFPSSTTDHRIRKSDRFDITAPMHIRENEDGSRKARCVCRNISDTGCLIASDEDLDAGDEALLCMALYGDGAYHEAPCLVRNVIERKWAIEYGIEFKFSDDEQIKLHKAFIQKLSAIHRQHGKELAEAMSDEESLICGANCIMEINGRKCNAEIVGAKDGVYLLTNTPRHNGVNVIAEANAVITAKVRYISGGTVFGFFTSLTKQMTKPANIWAWTYPSDTESVEVRKSRRVKTFISAEIFAGSEPLSGVIVNLSGDGALIVSDEGYMDIGQDFFIDMTLTTGETVKGFECKVCRIVQGNGSMLLGVSFSGSGQDREVVNGYYNLCVSDFSGAE